MHRINELYGLGVCTNHTSIMESFKQDNKIKVQKHTREKENARSFKSFSLLLVVKPL